MQTQNEPDSDSLALVQTQPNRTEGFLYNIYVYIYI